MSRAFAVVAAVAVAGCFNPVIDAGDGGSAGGTAGGTAGGSAGGTAGGASAGGVGGSSGGSAGGSGQSCVTTSQCAGDQVCTGCLGARHCERGCNGADVQAPSSCPVGETCGSPVACLVCPCPPAQCQPNTPCIDDDHDGYVPGVSGCSSKPGGDCNDHDATVHPGAFEQCTNGRDDNCNGLVDGADPACFATCGGSNTCSSSFGCALGTSFCDGQTGARCCQSCPQISITCAPGYAPRPAGVDPQTGCKRLECFPDMACPALYAPVCGINGSTYGNSCEAAAATAVIAHAGECTPGEGMNCEFSATGTPSCGTSGLLYCRDACPQCRVSQRVCTQTGVCLVDSDCPAGRPPPPIPVCLDGGVVHPRCVTNGCVYTCN